jgi:hypothetical protein
MAVNNIPMCVCVCVCVWKVSPGKPIYLRLSCSRKRHSGILGSALGRTWIRHFGILGSALGRTWILMTVVRYASYLNYLHYEVFIHLSGLSKANDRWISRQSGNVINNVHTVPTEDQHHCTGCLQRCFSTTAGWPTYMFDTSSISFSNFKPSKVSKTIIEVLECTQPSRSLIQVGSTRARKGCQKVTGRI